MRPTISADMVGWRSAPPGTAGPDRDRLAADPPSRAARSARKLPTIMPTATSIAIAVDSARHQHRSSAQRSRQAACREQRFHSEDAPQEARDRDRNAGHQSRNREREGCDQQHRGHVAEHGFAADRRLARRDPGASGQIDCDHQVPASDARGPHVRGGRAPWLPPARPGKLPRLARTRRRTRRPRRSHGEPTRLFPGKRHRARTAADVQRLDGRRPPSAPPRCHQPSEHDAGERAQEFPTPAASPRNAARTALRVTPRARRMPISKRRRTTETEIVL